MVNLIKQRIRTLYAPYGFYLSPPLPALVFVPNYPYEVIFFFSCLSVFFLLYDDKGKTAILRFLRIAR